MSKALFGKAWFEGVEWPLWDLVHEQSCHPGDGYLPFVRAARELFHEAGGWFVSSEDGPVFVDRHAWSRARAARPTRR